MYDNYNYVATKLLMEIKLGVHLSSRVIIAKGGLMAYGIVALCKEFVKWSAAVLIRHAEKAFYKYMHATVCFHLTQFYASMHALFQGTFYLTVHNHLLATVDS